MTELALLHAPDVLAIADEIERRRRSYGSYGIGSCCCLLVIIVIVVVVVLLQRRRRQTPPPPPPPQ
jgi:hypothetical protein